MYNILYTYIYYITPRTLTHSLAHTQRYNTTNKVLLHVLATESSVGDYRRFHNRLIVRGDTVGGLLHNW